MNGTDPLARDTTANFVFILGMHRSGTSCLAGCLERSGLYLGEVSRRDPHNARGNHEPAGVLSLHFRILQANGGARLRPPDHIVVDESQRQEMAAIARELAAGGRCGVKQPDMLLLLDAWTEVVASVAGPWAMAGSFRHPAGVAGSLARRNQMPPELAHDLWQRYNTELVRWHQRRPFPLVEYDLSDAELYCRRVAALAARLGLAPNLPRLRQFVSGRLEHNSVVQAPVPAACQELYAYLQAHACQSPDQIPAGWLARPGLTVDGARRFLAPVERFVPPPLLHRGLRWLHRWEQNRR